MHLKRGHRHLSNFFWKSIIISVFSPNYSLNRGCLIKQLGLLQNKCQWQLVLVCCNRLEMWKVRLTNDGISVDLSLSSIKCGWCCYLLPQIVSLVRLCSGLEQLHAVPGTPLLFRLLLAGLLVGLLSNLEQQLDDLIVASGMLNSWVAVAIQQWRGVPLGQ